MFKSPFSFNGRIRRTEYGISYVLHIFFIYGFLFFVQMLDLTGYQILIPLGASYWFLFSQSAKRCHDLGNNGFYQIIPFYVFALIFSEGQRRSNQYGPDPKLLDAQTVAQPPLTKTNRLVLPEGKSKEAIGSELLSGIMLTALAVAGLYYFLGTESLVYFIVECILIMVGYFTVLLVSFSLNPLPHLPLYFMVHRAIFSLGFYLVIRIYILFSYNMTDITLTTLGVDLIYILSIYILSYIPYFFYKTRKQQNPVLLEA